MSRTLVYLTGHQILDIYLSQHPRGHSIGEEMIHNKVALLCLLYITQMSMKLCLLPSWSGDRLFFLVYMSVCFTMCPSVCLTVRHKMYLILSTQLLLHFSQIFLNVAGVLARSEVAVILKLILSPISNLKFNQCLA